MIKEYLEIGQIVGTHGVRGEMRVQPWCDSPDYLKKFKTLYFDARGEKSVKLESARAHKNAALLKLEGVDSIEDAEKLRGKILYMRREDAKLQKGDYFIAELMDCKVIDDEDESIIYGTVCDVLNNCSTDVWCIKNGDKEYNFPAIPDIVKSVDVVKGIVKITPLKGLFDDED